MAYNVILTDGSGNIVIPREQISNNLTSIPLVGREHSGYGQAIATAQIRMLENFANTTAPSNPLTGQIWYDKGDQVLRVYDPSAATAWRSLASSLNDLTDVDAESPDENQILRWDGSNWIASNEAGVSALAFSQLSDTPPTALQSNAFLRVNQGGTQINYVSEIPAAVLSGTIADARIPNNIVRQTRSINTGDGLDGGGDFSENRTLSVSTGDGIRIVGGNVAVTTDVVRTSRRIDTGSGLTGGGSLAGNRTLSVDGTVVRTSGTQSIGGSKTFTGLTSISTSTGTGHALNISRHTGSGIGNAVMRLFMSTTSPATYLFRADNSNGARVVITGSGNVGIGTANPSPFERLHVVGDVRWTGDLVDGNVPFARLTNVPEISVSNLIDKDSSTLGLISGRRFIEALATLPFGSVGTYVFGVTTSTPPAPSLGYSGGGLVEGDVIPGSYIYPSGGWNNNDPELPDNTNPTHGMLRGPNTLQGQWRVMGRVNRDPNQETGRWRQTLFLRVA